MKKTAESKEPIWWALFAAGGTVAAFLVPVHVFIYGIAGPLGWLPAAVTDFDSLEALARNPIVKLYLLVLISLPLFHWAHRFRFTLHDLGLKASPDAVAFVCYSSALLGVFATALVMLAVW